MERAFAHRREAGELLAARLAGIVDECVCVRTPRAFRSVGESYLDFAQVSDETVRELLDRSSGSPAR